MSIVGRPRGISEAPDWWSGRETGVARLHLHLASLAAVNSWEPRLQVDTPDNNGVGHSVVTRPITRASGRLA